MHTRTIKEDEPFSTLVTMSMFPAESRLENEPCTVASSSSNGLQVPSSGKFSFDNLVWTHKGKSLVAFIPKNRLKDYISGEGDRCSCSFATTNVVDKTKRSPKKSELVAYKATFNCSYGPQDDRKKHCIAHASSQATKRRSKQAFGEGVKVGCKAHFRATIYYKHLDIVELINPIL